jgi:sec-independent protein translocase protein TatA
MPFVGALEPPHLILVLVIVLIVFGPGKLPTLGRSLGDGIREFKKSVEPQPEPAPPDAPAAPAAPAQLTAATPLRCGNCGLAAPAGTKFCSGCGATLTGSTGPETTKEAVTR